MTPAEKLRLLERSLERCAAVLGDIAPVVAERFYRAHPAAQGRFDALYPNGRHQLEGEMVAQVLYCLMEWFATPGEIEVVLMSTVPHHIETLGVEPALFTGLIAAVCDTVTGTIPLTEAGERAVWGELHTALTTLAWENARYARPGRGSG